jgi:hypothetical protein
MQLLNQLNIKSNFARSWARAPGAIKTNTHLFDAVAFFAATHPTAALEVSSNSLASPVVKLRKLAVASFEYRLHLVLGLLGNWHDAVEVLVDEQTHEQL